MKNLSIEKQSSFKLWVNNLFHGISIHTDLISSVSILALDVIFLLGKIFPAFPQKLSQFSFVALNFSGLICLNFMVSFIRKTRKDCLIAQKAQSRLIFFETMVKVFYIGSGILLTVGMFLASVFIYFEKHQLVSIFYKVMRPWGALSIMIAIGLDVYYYMNNKRFIAKFDKVFSNQKKDRFSQLIHQLFHKQTACSIDKNEQKVLIWAATLRARTDKDTWKTFQNKLSCMEVDDLQFSREKQDSLCQMIECLKDNIIVQQQIASADLGVRGFGYVSMGINKIFPNTLIQGVVLLANASLYTSMLCYQKIKQYYHRKNIRAVEIS
ncbi:MAG TPA: hypothetical protein P5048_02710 [Chlamydiales bacterium]|nr:hypothetical protein [Chlamydiales bacterium]